MNFIESDKKKINNAYKNILFNLKDYLEQYNVKSEIECSKIIFNMLHNGLFSINRTIRFDNNYSYIGLPIEISQGVQVMYGICCCRHATAFLYDLLVLLNFNPTLIYFWIDDTTKIWRKVNPAIESVNHQAILSGGGEYIIDPRNKFIFQIQKNSQINSLDTNYFNNLSFYQEDNIEIVGKILKKYYTYKEFGVERVYEYNYN